jgi:hypothetical protein
MRIFVTALAALLLAGAASAQTAEHLAAVERASAVGWDLYEHDRAAWLGTDAMRADIRDPRAEGLRGWITERTADGVVLLFVKGDSEPLTAVYRALYRDGALREHGRVDQPLTELQARLYRARQIAIGTPIEQCSQSYNSVVLPRTTVGADGADVDVYLMPGAEQARQMPMGGHFRLAVDSAAGVVRETARFTNSCLTLQAEPGAEAMFVSQIIGDTPTEIHVFESLTVDIPIFVMARSGIWQVDGRAIRFERPPSQQN